VVEKTKDINAITCIFERYPPLTRRVFVQLQFLREMQQKASLGLASEELMPVYFAARSSKYSVRASLSHPRAAIYTSLPHYNV